MLTSGGSIHAEGTVIERAPGRGVLPMVGDTVWRPVWLEQLARRVGGSGVRGGLWAMVTALAFILSGWRPLEP